LDNLRPTSARDQAIRKLLIALCLLLLSWQTATAQAPLEQALKHHRLRLRQLETALQKGQIPYVPELNGRPVFESVLGIYGQGVRGPRYPLINLKPPCAAELWSEEVQAAGRRCTSAGNPRLTFSTAAPSLQQIFDPGQVPNPLERGEPDLLAPPRRTPQR
jgi:hypothetical protein